MTAPETIWNALLPQIEKGISDSPSGVFALSEVMLSETLHITDELWREVLLINKQEQRFIVRKYLFEWTFRRP